MSDAVFLPPGLDRDRLAAALAGRGLDGLLLTSPENVFYATGFPAVAGVGNPIMAALHNQFPTFALAQATGSITLVCWGLATFGVTYGADAVRAYFTPDQALDELRAALCADLPGRARLGVEDACPLAIARLAESDESAPTLLPAGDVMEGLRLVKSPAEIELVRESTRIVERSVEDLVPMLQLGMSRLDLLRAAKERMIANGADGVDHVTVAFGSANPEVALGEPLERDQLVTLDLGAVYRGYVSDNRRYAFAGTVPSDLKERHATMCGIVAELGAMLRPGVTFGQVHARAHELHAAAGVDPLFISAGHSMGLQVEERWMVADDPTPIAQGMVLNLELYSFTEAGVMVGDEETYVVGADGPEQLTRLPTDIVELDLA